MDNIGASDYLHFEVYMEPSDSIRVELDRAAYVRIMDTVNYNRFANSRQSQHHVTCVKQSPVRIKSPLTGHVHIVIDLGGRTGDINAHVAVV